MVVAPLPQPTSMIAFARRGPARGRSGDRRPAPAGCPATAAGRPSAGRPVRSNRRSGRRSVRGRQVLSICRNSLLGCPRRFATSAGRRSILALSACRAERQPHHDVPRRKWGIATRFRRNPRCYLILATHSFRRSSSERTCVSMASCNASVPLLGQFCRRLSVQILLPIPDCLLGGGLGFRRSLKVRLYAGVGHRTSLALMSGGSTRNEQGKSSQQGPSLFFRRSAPRDVLLGWARLQSRL